MNSTEADARDSVTLLKAWYAGETEAADHLVRRHTPWLHRLAERQLSHGARRLHGAEDVVSEVLMKIISEGPRFEPRSELEFRALVARMTVNLVRDHVRWAHAQVRDAGREVPLPSAISRIGAYAGSGDEPPLRAERDEERAFVALALRLIRRDDHDLIQWKQFHAWSFTAIGTELGITADAARSRYRAALRRLKAEVQQLKEGATADHIDSYESQI